jgi:hypothetical protein
MSIQNNKIFNNTKTMERDLALNFYKKQDDIFDKTKYSETDIFLAKDKKDGKKEYAIASILVVMEWLKQNNNLYEILKTDRPRKFYIDLDAPYDKIRSRFSDDIHDTKMKYEVVDIVILMIKDFFEEYNLELGEINVLDSSNEKKISFHFCMDVLIRNYSESKIIHEKFLSFCNDTYNNSISHRDIHLWFDKSVYSRNRLMRTYNQSKIGSDRLFNLFYGSEDPKDHLISYFNKLVNTIIPKEGWISAYNNYVKSFDDVNEGRIIKDYDKDEALQFYAENSSYKANSRTGDNTANYQDWRDWVWACMGAGVSIEKIHELSYKVCPEKYSKKDTDNHIRSYDKNRIEKRGLSSLKKWCRDVGKILEVKEKRKDEKTLTFVDLVIRYQGKVFESKRQAIDTMFEDVKGVVSYILTEKFFTYYANDDNPYKIDKNLPRLNVMIKGDKSVEKISLQKLIEEYPLEMPIYDKLVFKPNDYRLKPREKNTYCGIKATLLPEYDILKINHILNHFLVVLANNNEEYYKYILTWVRQTILYPEKPTDIFLLFQGEQGSGKSIIPKFMIEKLIGKGLSFSTSGLNALTGRFNGCIRGKTFVNCNELTTLSDTGYHNAFDKMKNLITDRLVQIEHKGLEHIQIDNHCNFMGTTNNSFVAKLEQGDRRYACFTTNNEKVGDDEYFDKLVSQLESEESANHFLTYLSQMKDEDIVNLRKIPLTELRKEMMAASKSNVETFIEELLEGDMIDNKEWIDKDNKEIENKTLYAHYLNWCCGEGEKAYKNSCFSRMIPRKYISERFNKRVNKKMCRGIRFR